MDSSMSLTRIPVYTNRKGKGAPKGEKCGAFIMYRNRLHPTSKGPSPAARSGRRWPASSSPPRWTRSDARSSRRRLRAHSIPSSSRTSLRPSDGPPGNRRMGGIGAEVARLCKAFRMHTIGLSRSRPQDPALDEAATIDDLRRFLPRADFVVLALPLTRQTAGLVDRAFLAAMKPDAVLVN